MCKFRKADWRFWASLSSSVKWSELSDFYSLWKEKHASVLLLWAEGGTGMHPGQVRPGLPGARSTRRGQGQVWVVSAARLAGGRAGRRAGRGRTEARSAPISARLFCASPQRREGQARSSGSLPPCACGLSQTKKRLCFVFLPSMGADFRKTSSGDVFLVKSVKCAGQPAHAVTEGKPGGTHAGRRLRAAFVRARGSLHQCCPEHRCFPPFLVHSHHLSPPSAHQCFSFVGHHSQDDFINHRFPLS